LQRRELQVMAKAFAATGGSDPTKAIKKFETFGLQDQTPTTSITGPGGSVLTSTTFVATGTAGDDNGVDALSYWFRDASNQYLQEDGSVASSRVSTPSGACRTSSARPRPPGSTR
jgi:hypothetical protein